MKVNWLISLSFLVLFFGCKETAEEVTPRPTTATMYFPPLSGNQWESYSPADLDWCPDKLADLQTYLEAKNTKAFIILKDGKIATEWYFDSFTKDSVWYWASAGKSLTAFLLGVAQQERALSLSDKTSDYLGTGWTSATAAQEQAITIRHQLSMTTGLDDGVANDNCTSPDCLLYLSDAGARWAYHNGPYTLLGKVLEQATGLTRNNYTYSRLHAKTGMSGNWLVRGDNEVFFSTARSMARFGLLMLNRGSWEKEVLLQDSDYFQEMVNSSQALNPAYGYLWWLNGKSSHKLPTLQTDFAGSLIPNAPTDLIAAMGLNDQKIYVVPSQQLVVIRMGKSAGLSRHSLSSFDNELWGKLSDLACD